MTGRNKYRNAVNNVMLTLSGICAAVTVSMLFVILAYLVYNGFSSLNLDFFTQLPKPTGQVGGGMANAILGSAQVVLIASCFGLPIGFFAGIYLAEFGGKKFCMLVRYMADLLNGVPSIVIGIFAWTVLVVPMHHFSALAGGMALSLMLIPITARSTEQFLLEVPRSMREGALALGATKWKTIATVIVPAARHHDRHDSGRRPHLRRDGAAAVYRPQQRILEHRIFLADRNAAGDDFHSRRCSLRRLAQAGLGGGTCPADDGARR